MRNLSFASTLILLWVFLPFFPVWLVSSIVTLNQHCLLTHNLCNLNEYCDWDMICRCKANYHSPDGTTCVPETCTADVNCGVNARCDPNLHTCACKNTYRANANGTCDKVTVGRSCSDTIECIPNAECLYGRCACKNGFDLRDYQCRKVRIGEHCKKWYDNVHEKAENVCGNNASCIPPMSSNELHSPLTDKLCLCNANFVPSLNGVDCKIMECHSDSDCFGDTYCNLGSHRCRCQAGFQYSNSSYSCVKAKLNESCDMTNSACGKNAECVDGKCRCEEYYYSNAVTFTKQVRPTMIYHLPLIDENLVNCRKPSIFGEPCSVNKSTCGKNAFCREQLNQCLCLPGFMPNLTSGHDCMSVHNPNFIFCMTSIQCSVNSYCVDNHCVCEHGFQRSSNLFECEPKPDVSCLTYTTFVITLAVFFLLSIFTFLTYYHCNVSRLLNFCLNKFGGYTRETNQSVSFSNSQNEFEIGIQEHAMSSSYRNFQ